MMNTGNGDSEVSSKLDAVIATMNTLSAQQSEMRAKVDSLLTAGLAAAGPPAVATSGDSSSFLRKNSGDGVPEQLSDRGRVSFDITSAMEMVHSANDQYLRKSMGDALTHKPSDHAKNAKQELKKLAKVQQDEGTLSLETAAAKLH